MGLHCQIQNTPQMTRSLSTVTVLQKGGIPFPDTRNERLYINHRQTSPFLLQCVSDEFRIDKHSVEHRRDRQLQRRPEVKPANIRDNQWPRLSISCAGQRDRRVCALDPPPGHSEQLQAAGRTAHRLGGRTKGVRRAAIRPLPAADLENRGRTGAAQPSEATPPP